MIEITIPNWHPTPLNKLLGHWAVAARLKKADRQMVFAYAPKQHTKPNKRRVHLCIELGKGQRRCDPDAYWKSMNDALVAAGLLRDDSDNWCELAPVQFKRGEMATHIRLVDIS